MSDTYRCPCCEQDVPCHREHSWTECSGYLKAEIERLREELNESRKMHADLQRVIAQNAREVFEQR